MTERLQMIASADERITSYRGFFPAAVPANAYDIRRLWELRLEEASGAHPVWMHVHVPYCPQICTFCHCGRLLLRNENEIESWLERIRAEAAFFSPVMAGAQITRQYFGGGTPNILSPAQLDELLDILESQFEHSPNARRTFEVLPSTHKWETLEVAARHGINRISAGVQTTANELLKPYARAPDFGTLERVMEDATKLGIADINIDLVWGLRGDSEDMFFTSLADVLSLNPTSVSVHLLAPTAQNPVYSSEVEEFEVYRRFRTLSDGIQAEQLEEQFPNYVWRKLPTVMAVIRKDYLDAGHYFSWQYSDMETVGIDMFGLGRFSLSHLLGWARYENRTAVGEFVASEPGYKLTRVDKAIDASMDVLAELLRDGVCDFTRIQKNYGPRSSQVVHNLLNHMVSESSLLRKNNIYFDLRPADSLLGGPLLRLLEFARQRATKLSDVKPTDVKPAKWIDPTFGKTCEEVRETLGRGGHLKDWQLEHSEMSGNEVSKQCLILLFRQGDGSNLAGIKLERKNSNRPSYAQAGIFNISYLNKWKGNDCIFEQELMDWCLQTAEESAVEPKLPNKVSFNEIGF